VLVIIMQKIFEATMLWDDSPKIRVSQSDFVEIATSNPSRTLFRLTHNDLYSGRSVTHYFFSENGVIVYTEGIPDAKSLDEFNEYILGNIENEHKKQKMGFKNMEEFVRAQELGIPNGGEYREFIDSGFETESTLGAVNQYKMYLEAKARGFKNYPDYTLAKRLDVDNGENLDAFKGAWAKEYFLSTLGCASKEDYQIFLRMKEYGVASFNDYRLAMQAGFTDPFSYKKSLEEKKENHREEQRSSSQGSSSDDDGGDDYDDDDCRTPNDDRSDSMNPNNDAYKDAEDNRSNQMNPNNSAYHDSRGHR
jgi:hypothetical protein